MSMHYSITSYYGLSFSSLNFSLLLFSILFSAKALALSLFSVNVSDDVKAHGLVVGSASNHFEGLLLYLTNALEKAYSSLVVYILSSRHVWPFAEGLPVGRCGPPPLSSPKQPTTTVLRPPLSKLHMQ